MTTSVIQYTVLSKLLETCAFVFNNVATAYQQNMYSWIDSYKTV